MVTIFYLGKLVATPSKFSSLLLRTDMKIMFDTLGATGFGRRYRSGGLPYWTQEWQTANTIKQIHKRCASGYDTPFFSPGPSLTCFDKLKFVFLIFPSPWSLKTFRNRQLPVKDKNVWFSPTPPHRPGPENCPINGQR